MCARACVHGCLGQCQSLGIEESDCLGEETVTQFGREGPNVSVPFASWQEGEEFV